jgi:hypothetical protein
MSLSVLLLAMVSWPKEEGQKIPWPKEKGQTIPWPKEGQIIP